MRASNDMGINLYKRLGYTTYRRVLGYYSNVEDALGAISGLPAGPVSIVMHRLIARQGAEPSLRCCRYEKSNGSGHEEGVSRAVEEGCHSRRT